DPGLELGAVAAALERAFDPAAALEPRAEGPWLPAERYSEALLLAQAFARRGPGRLHGARCARAQARRRGARACPRARATAAGPPSARGGARGGRMTKNRFRTWPPSAPPLLKAVLGRGI